MRNFLKLVLAFGFVALTLSFILHVNNEPNVGPSTSPSPSPSSSAPLTAIDIAGCYVYNHTDGTRYTVFLEAQSIKNLEGFIEYNNVGFDSSRGGFSGEFIAPRLIGIYDFFAEGTQSKRQLVFFLEDDSLIAGSGDSEIVDGVEVFIDLDSVTKNYNYVFRPGAGCAEQ